ncbi:MAG TPA: hypothetical protein VE757_00200 [Gaiellaceae bacterium]|nr:hypothetical protein [Gaiellaceae bacterium]
MSFPGGTVTFLFTDIEGSTRLLQELGDDYGQVVANHRDIQHEHVYELALDESGRSFPPLKTPLTGKAAFENRFDDRIERYIEDTLESALSGSPTRQVRSVAGGLASLVLVVAAVVAIILLIRLAT